MDPSNVLENMLRQSYVTSNVLDNMLRQSYVTVGQGEFEAYLEMNIGSVNVPLLFYSMCLSENQKNFIGLT